MKTLSNILSFFVFLTSSLQAAGPMIAPMQASIPERIQAGNQYYDMSVSGLGAYMEELKVKDPKSHQALTNELEDLKSRRTRATWIPIGVGAVGVLLTVVGGSSSPSSIPVLVGGSILITASLLLPYLLSNDRTNFMDFVNKHNRLRPQNPVQIQFGLMPLPSALSGVIALTF
jgi:hypothetical protein